MKTIIMTFKTASKDRKNNIKELQKSLEALGMESEVFSGGKNTVKNFSDICSENPEGFILLEDDVKLLPTFSGFLELTEKYPGDLVSGYYPLNNLQKTARFQMSEFAWGQCLYVPEKIAKAFPRKCPAYAKAFPLLTAESKHDSLIGVMFSGMTFVSGEKAVEHLMFESELGHQRLDLNY